MNSNKIFKKDIGKKYFITENARVLLGIEDGIEFTLMDILDGSIAYPYVLSSAAFENGLTEYFNEDELIEIEKQDKNEI